MVPPSLKHQMVTFLLAAPVTTFQISTLSWLNLIVMGIYCGTKTLMWPLIPEMRDTVALKLQTIIISLIFMEPVSTISSTSLHLIQQAVSSGQSNQQIPELPMVLLPRLTVV